MHKDIQRLCPACKLLHGANRERCRNCGSTLLVRVGDIDWTEKDQIESDIDLTGGIIEDPFIDEEEITEVIVSLWDIIDNRGALISELETKVGDLINQAVDKDIEISKLKTASAADLAEIKRLQTDKPKKKTIFGK